MKPYYEREGVAIFRADCREALPSIDPAAVALVLTDPPYGLTANAWDDAISPDELAALLRPFKTVVLTASQPFTARAVCADEDRFRHEWIWLKNRGSNFANTVRAPMKEHESVLVFSDGKWTYNPQRQPRSGSGEDRVRHKVAFRTQSANYRAFEGRAAADLPKDRVPSSVQFFQTEVGLHPTQKPEALFAYLVQTYSNPGDLVLDPFMGSGTTLAAASALGRRAIGIERDPNYCAVAARRLQQAALPLEVPA